MKYQKIIYSLIIASALTACSQMEEDLAAGEDAAAASAESVDFIGGDSDVEIRLGTSTNLTRGLVSPDNNGNFETTSGIGIFMLASEVSTTNPLANPIEYREYAYNERHARTIALNNVKANAKILTSETPNITSLAWDYDTVYYYPIDNWYGYRFYGYHPYQEDSNVSLSDEVFKVVIPADSINGQTDILYGQSLKPVETDAEDEYSKYRYSAKYMRYCGGTKTPSVTFKHKLIAFQFKVKGVPDYDNSYNEVRKLTVKSIIVGAIPEGDATLTIANLNNQRANDATDIPDAEDEEGFISFDWTEENRTKTINVLKDGDTNLNLQIGADGDGVEQICGDTILLPAPPADVTEALTYTYTVDITLHYNNGSDNPELGTDMPLQLHFTEPVVEGHVYDVLLNIASPQIINIKATLKDWESGEGSTPIELN